MTTEREAATEESTVSSQPSSWWRWRTWSVAPRLRLWEPVAYGGLLVTAGAMRLWDLGSRAVHHDESLHAYYSWNLSEGLGFQHNPMMHGPFQFEGTAAMFFIFGDSDYTSRLLYALLGTALIAMPFLFRARLGRLGALLVSVMLAFSPAMLYFSRFARNDILMAVWTLGLVTCMWRFIDEGKNRYLYIGSALLALAFATKETSFIITLILGLFLVLATIVRGWTQTEMGPIVGVVSPPVAVMRLGSTTWSALRRGIALSNASRPASFLILLVTLSLPQWSAAVSWFQDTSLLSWTNLTLAETEGSIGAPSGGGLVIATLAVLVLLTLSAYWGFRWNWSVWWRSALIFYAIWVLLYSTFFTHLGGVSSGIWKSLGYWIVQQDVARGSQPWYYYFMIASVYEFLPFLFGIVAAIYYLRKRDRFGLFLVYWAVATFVLYIAASEKMPWLLVNISLPLIVLSGRFLGEVIQGIEWRRLMSGGGILLLPGVPLFLALLWRLTFYESGTSDLFDILVPLALGVVLLGLIGVGIVLARRSGTRNFAAFATVPVAIMLLVLTIRAASIAAYQNGDVPVEMIVYTQTSPDIAKLSREIERVGEVTGEEVNVPVTIDDTSGFSWPWAWYLRDYKRVRYQPYRDRDSDEAEDSSVVLVHDSNEGDASVALEGLYSEGERIKHRWWFPEDTYRQVTLGKFLRSFGNRDTWRSAMDYLLYREGIRDRIGSEDAYLYFSQETPSDFSPSE